MKLGSFALLLCALAASSVALHTAIGHPSEVLLPDNPDMKVLQQFNQLKKEAWSMFKTMTPNIQSVKRVTNALISARKGLKACSQQPENVDCASTVMQKARAEFQKVRA